MESVFSGSFLEVSNVRLPNDFEYTVSPDDRVSSRRGEKKWRVVATLFIHNHKSRTFEVILHLTSVLFQYGVKFLHFQMVLRD